MIYLNKLSALHDGHKIFFCKTDFLDKDFAEIATLDHDVVLVTGNSDYSITNKHIRHAPKNIKKWFAQNALSDSDIVEPIPIGIENKIPSFREGHGVAYLDRVSIKEALLERKKNIDPQKDVYGNFKVIRTGNPHAFPHRTAIKDLCIKSDFIDWHEADLHLNEYFDEILAYKMSICPAGNGIDTHRLWEVLYSGRVPITIKMSNFKIYEMYKKLPIIILDDENKLLDKQFIMNKYEEVTSRENQMELLNIEYWIKKIKEVANV
jgi:hypothetical protein